MTLILELPDNKEAALKARALSQGVSAEQFVQRIVDRELELQETPASRPAAIRLNLPALPLGNIGSLRRRDIYDDAP